MQKVSPKRKTKQKKKENRKRTKKKDKEKNSLPNKPTRPKHVVLNTQGQSKIGYKSKAKGLITPRKSKLFTLKNAKLSRLSIPWKKKDWKP